MNHTNTLGRHNEHQRKCTILSNLPVYSQIIGIYNNATFNEHLILMHKDIFLLNPSTIKCNNKSYSPETITSVSFSKEGTSFVTSSKEGSLSLWNAYSKGFSKNTLIKGKIPILKVSFTKDNKNIVYVTETGDLFTYNISSKCKQRIYSSYKNSTCSFIPFTLSNKNNTIYIAKHPDIIIKYSLRGNTFKPRILKLRSRTLFSKTNTKTPLITDLLISSNDTLYAAFSNGTIGKWEHASKTHLLPSLCDKFQGPNSPITTMILSPKEDELVIFNKDNQIIFLDTMSDWNTTSPLKGISELPNSNIPSTYTTHAAYTDSGSAILINDNHKNLITIKGINYLKPLHKTINEDGQIILNPKDRTTIVSPLEL